MVRPFLRDQFQTLFLNFPLTLLSVLGYVCKRDLCFREQCLNNFASDKSTLSIAKAKDDI